MGSNIVPPDQTSALIQRLKLYNPNFGVPQAPAQAPVDNPFSVQTPDQVQPLNPPSTQAPAVSPRDQALAAYQEALKTPTPSQADYHPSILRRIAGAVLGGAVGSNVSHNPNAPLEGYKLAQKTVYGPYEQQLTDYQKRLAQKKEAYETEEAAEESQAKTAEQLAQKEADVSRKGSEEASRIKQEGEARALIPGTPEFKGKVELEQLKNKPGAIKLSRVTLKNGEEVLAQETPQGMVEYGTGTIIGPDAIDTTKTVPFTGLPKETAAKPPREKEDGFIDAWSLEHGGKSPNVAQRLNLHRQYEAAGHTEDQTIQDIRLAQLKNSSIAPYQKDFDAYSHQLDRIDLAAKEISSGTPESIALSIPETLTALISGPSSGARITTPEMNNLIKARGLSDSLEAVGNKITGKGNLANAQKKDLISLLSDVRDTVEKKQEDLNERMNDIDNAKTANDISKVRVSHRTGKSTVKEEDKSDPLGILK